MEISAVCWRMGAMAQMEIWARMQIQVSTQMKIWARMQI